ncbi:MAG: mechanosensitive ion channel [Desulfoarculaceae bacterium]|nr:mechanosensitive ion channel [Desulfoarculaceae bacterium]
MERYTFLKDLFAMPLMQRFMILVIYAVLAKAVDIFINRILKRIARNMTKTDMDDKIFAIIHTPVVMTVIFLGALHLISVEPIPGPPWGEFLPQAVKSVALIIWTIAFLHLFGLLAEKYLIRILERGKIGTDLFLLFKNLARTITVIMSLLWLLSIWRVNMAPLFASAGIAGIAVALAAKDTLANFFGGISIFTDRTFKVGDYIILDGVERGEVVEIGIRSTRILTRDNVQIIVPNAILANSKIVNESAPEPRFRIRVPVGVAYGSDLEQVEAVLLTVVHNNPAVVRDPAPRVRMRSFGSSSVDFEILCWVEDPRFKGLEIHNLLKATYRAFAENDIAIPFPQQDVYIKQFPCPGTDRDEITGALKQEGSL